jgi:hypothetical protein
MVSSPRLRALLLAGPAGAALAAALLLPPVSQSPSYHDFADARALLGVRHFWNVASNLGFLGIGAAGAIFALRSRTAFRNPKERWPYVAIFGAVFLTGLGSAWYHLAPDDARLVWDRLPMALVFMSAAAVVAGERLGPRAGLLLLPALLAAGAASVLWWAGTGDLRFYALAQYYPLVAIPLGTLLVPSPYTRSGDLVGAAAWYGIAKACDLADAAILDALGALSGHTLKHGLAAMAAFWVLRMLRKRRQRDANLLPVVQPA